MNTKPDPNEILKKLASNPKVTLEDVSDALEEAIPSPIPPRQGASNIDLDTAINFFKLKR